MSDEKWYKLRGKWAQIDLWVAPEWEGRPEYGIQYLEDGSDPDYVLAAQGPEALPYPIWFQHFEGRGKRRADILWCGGLPIKVASRRFVERLTELGVTGFRTYEIELWDKRKKNRIDGYVGFIEDLTGRGELMLYPNKGGGPTFSMLCTERVLSGLREAGVDLFEVEKYSPPKYHKRWWKQLRKAKED